MTYTLSKGETKLEGYIKTLLRYPGKSQKGSKGKKVKLIQQWLCYHGLELRVDSDFGRVTETRVKNFQSQSGLPETGIIDEVTHNALTAPLRRVLTPIAVPPSSFEACVAAYARRHLLEIPQEIKGTNDGPWVRLYMDGNEGEDFAWCAGFVKFLMNQAAESLNMTMPVKGHWGCDQFVDQAKEAGIFVEGRGIDKSKIVPGSLFVALKEPGDYGHIGVVTFAGSDYFETIEGNTNLDQSYHGVKVCAQLRSYGDTYDFIVFDPDAAHVNNIIPTRTELVANKPDVDVRRYFYEGLTPNPLAPELLQEGYSYGSLFAHWGGWITAGHVIFDSNYNPPPFAGGSLEYRPGQLDAALVGCTVPDSPPSEIKEQDPIIVCGFPAGSSVASIRSGRAYLYRSPEEVSGKKYGRWSVVVDEPHEPVVPGMSGGVAVNGDTGEIVGIITHANSPGNYEFGNPNPDPEDEHSLDIVGLYELWHAVKGLELDAPRV